MNNDHVAVVYFSGTGGTAMIARELERRLSEARTTKLFSLDRKEQRIHEVELASLPDEAGMLVILYPVYALDAAEPIFDWLLTAPPGKNMKTAVISVSGGGEMWPNAACRHRVIKRLEKKGYDVFYENMMIMPQNCLYRGSDHLSMHLLNAVPVKSAAIVNDILAAKRRRTKFPWGSWPFLWFGYWERKGARQIGKYVEIRDTCTACGQCVRNCPKENIVMKEGRPDFGTECVLCLRCHYGCPAHAIDLKKMRVPIWDEYDLERIRDRMKGVPLEPVEKCAKGWLFAGIREYLKR